MFVDVRDPHTHKLLFRYDPDRELIEVQDRKVKTVIDLTAYKDRTAEPQSATERHTP